MEKVFGIGLNKTGTTTLGACLKQMGYKHQSHSEAYARMHYDGRISELMAVARKYDSFEDWPWPLMFKELSEEFPEAKFVLTKRTSADAWLKSLTTHSYKLPPDENYHELVYGYKYPLGHKNYHLNFYNQHNAAVTKHFEDQPDRLLEIDWSIEHDWSRLCSFLGTATIEGALPHMGATENWAVPRTRLLQNRVLAVCGIFSTNNLPQSDA